MILSDFDISVVSSTSRGTQRCVQLTEEVRYRLADQKVVAPSRKVLFDLGLSSVPLGWFQLGSVMEYRGAVRAEILDSSPWCDCVAELQESVIRPLNERAAPWSLALASIVDAALQNDPVFSRDIVTKRLPRKGIVVSLHVTIDENAFRAVLVETELATGIELKRHPILTREPVSTYFGARDAKLNIVDDACSVMANGQEMARIALARR